MHDVWVFGDSHWRVFFPFVNHKVTTPDDPVIHEQGGIRTIDTIGNSLSGSTMWGLQNPNSRHGARRTILQTLTSLGGVDNIGLTFGEVDARYHNERYFNKGSMQLDHSALHRLMISFIDFIEEDLQPLVRGKIFIYHGYDYPQMENTLLQPAQPMGYEAYTRAWAVNCFISDALPDYMNSQNCHVINPIIEPEYVSQDGVHLIPEKIYPHVLGKMQEAFDADHD